MSPETPIGPRRGGHSRATNPAATPAPVSRASPTEIVVTIEDGLEGVIPEGYVHLLGNEGRPGAILKAAITSIDAEKRLIMLRPAEPKKA